VRVRVLPGHFAVARLRADEPLPAWGPQGALWSVTRRGEELSIVCLEDVVPGDVAAERGFHALDLPEPMAFDVVGVLASLAAPLAAAGIPILALSTFETDVLLVRDLDGAVAALREAGFAVEDAR
jgi:hypothetical protein